MYWLAVLSQRSPLLPVVSVSSASVGPLLKATPSALLRHPASSARGLRLVGQLAAPGGIATSLLSARSINQRPSDAVGTPNAIARCRAAARMSGSITVGPPMAIA